MFIKKNLDLGCAYGSLIYYLYNLGYKNIYGIDTDKNKIMTGQSYYKELSSSLLYYDGNIIPYKDNTFDIILCYDGIEHIPNLDKFLAGQVYRVLNQTGLFIFQTPNKITNVIWEVINKRSFTKYKEYHCSLQNIKSLKSTLRKAKFYDINVEKHNIITEHNKSKVKDKIGIIGLPILYLLQAMLLFYIQIFGAVAKNNPFACYALDVHAALLLVMRLIPKKRTGYLKQVI